MWRFKKHTCYILRLLVLQSLANIFYSPRTNLISIVDGLIQYSLVLHRNRLNRSGTLLLRFTTQRWRNTGGQLTPTMLQFRRQLGDFIFFVVRVNEVGWRWFASDNWNIAVMMRLMVRRWYWCLVRIVMVVRVGIRRLGSEGWRSVRWRSFERSKHKVHFVQQRWAKIENFVRIDFIIGYFMVFVWLVSSDWGVWPTEIAGLWASSLITNNIYCLQVKR